MSVTLKPHTINAFTGVCGAFYNNRTQFVEHCRQHLEHDSGTQNNCSWVGCPRFSRGFGAQYKLVNHFRVHTGKDHFWYIFQTLEFKNILYGKAKNPLFVQCQIVISVLPVSKICVFMFELIQARNHLCASFQAVIDDLRIHLIVKNMHIVTILALLIVQSKAVRKGDSLFWDHHYCRI